MSTPIRLCIRTFALIALGWCCSCGGREQPVQPEHDEGGVVLLDAEAPSDAADSRDAVLHDVSIPMEGGPVCVPTTCEQSGAECGAISDGCGEVLWCGACESGTCGARGPNKCGAGLCTPRRCSDQNIGCGLASDRCGGVIDCGSCPAPLVCIDHRLCGHCVPGAERCNANNVQKCGADGEWTDEAACAFLCISTDAGGACGGICKPDARQCNGHTVQTCTADGQWSDTQVCSGVCVSGYCTGCLVGVKQCFNNVPQGCDDAGLWLNGPACPFVCSQGECTGVCIPGSRRCSGDVPQVCDSRGQWANGASCAGACGDGGICEPTPDAGSDSAVTSR